MGYGRDIVGQDLIVYSMAHELSLGQFGIRLSCTTHCWLVRYDCFEFLRYACFAVLPSRCYSLHLYHRLHCIPWIMLAVYLFILSLLPSVTRGRDSFNIRTQSPIVILVQIWSQSLA